MSSPAKGPAHRTAAGIASALLHRYATPFTTGLFLVSTVSGVALFFHWLPGAFHAMHEWLSMLLLLPFALHLWKNWRPLLAYIRRRSLFIPLLLCVLAAVPFAAQSLAGGHGRQGNPAMQLLQLASNAPLQDLAPLLHTDPAGLQARLVQAGYAVSSPQQSLAQIAAADQVNVALLLRQLLFAPPARHGRP